MQNDWIAIIAASIASADKPEHASRAVPRLRAPEQAISELERTCGIIIPAALRELLSQSNGIMEQTDFGRGFENNYWIVEPTDEIAERFTNLRPEDEDDDSHAEAAGMFLFGGPGVDGVCFGFGDGVRFPRDAIVAYFPMAGDVTLMAPDLRTFFEWWLSQRLSLAGWDHRAG